VALHWGPVKSGPAGDVLGVDSTPGFPHGKRANERSNRFPTTPKRSLPISNRIVISRYALDRLPPAEHAKFSYAGKFLLKG
jgi:hypothetical protein